jgi:hypothetical protein
VSREDGRLSCATYTHARRHPMVLGRIGDWTPPVQLTFLQVGVVMATLALLYFTWNLWAGHLPLGLIVLVLIVGPAIPAVAVRHVRVEGRSTLRAAVGWLAYMWATGRDQVGGRSYRDRTAYLGDSWIHALSPDEDGRGIELHGPGTQEGGG